MTAMTTTFYPDVSSAQAGMSLAGAAAVCAKVTEGTGYLNPAYAQFKAQAEADGTLFLAYHFLHRGYPAAQAAWCYRHAGPVPVMVDCEPSPGIASYPQIADLTGFADAYRQLGGTVHLVYLPRWYWAAPPREGGLGSPALLALAMRRLVLVSSDYLGYTENGPGWQPYGGMTPLVWQYTENAVWNGCLVDRNAFRGTAAQLGELAATGMLTPARPATTDQEDDMQLISGAGQETIVSFERGSRSWIAFACDASRTKSAAPALRVAAHSASKGMTQIEPVTLPLSGKATFRFTERDVDFLSVVRDGGNAGDDVAVGYNLG
jgi:lysozyme